MSRRLQLIVLALVHFTVDFYAGLTVTIAEPTLTSHLGVGISRVAFLVGGCALLINVIQPVSQWLLPRGGAAILLLVTPLMAATMALIGLSGNYWIVAAMLTVSAVGIGIVHPEGALVAHSLAGKHEGMGISSFIAGGYLGFSLGGLVAGLWTEYHDQGLANFWMLLLPSLIVTALVVASRVHRYDGHMNAEATGPDTGNGAIPFCLVLTLAIGVAINMCLLGRLLPILLVRTFPELDAQGWSGAAVFATGVGAVTGMFIWGHLSQRFGRGRTITVVMLSGLPFLWMLLHLQTISLAPVWAIGVGFTIGGIFPLCILLARQAHGLPRRLRIGLALGGAWGSGEIAFMCAGKYIGQFPEGAIAPVASMLNLCWLAVTVAIVSALLIARINEKAQS